jgi:hypothetical protein
MMNLGIRDDSLLPGGTFHGRSVPQGRASAATTPASPGGGWSARSFQVSKPRQTARRRRPLSPSSGLLGIGALPRTFFLPRRPANGLVSAVGAPSYLVNAPLDRDIGPFTPVDVTLTVVEVTSHAVYSPSYAVDAPLDAVNGTSYAVDVTSTAVEITSHAVDVPLNVVCVTLTAVDGM